MDDVSPLILQKWEKRYGLNEQMMRFIITNYQKPGFGLVKIARKIFGDRKISSKDKRINDLRNFVLAYERHFRGKHLTEEQKEFIDKNYRIMSAYDMAKEIFPPPEGKRFEPLSLDAKKVYEYIKIKGYSEVGGKPMQKYKPPKQPKVAIKKINKVSYDSQWPPYNELSSRKKFCVDQLMSYLNSPRFSAVYQKFETESERELYEDEFIKSTFNKPDLSTEEVNLYINLCINYVLQLRVQQQMNDVNKMIDEATSDPSGDTKQIRITLTDLLGKKTTEFEKLQTRIEKLTDTLTGTRKNRLEAMAKVNESISSIVEQWKEAEKREHLIKMAKVHEDKVLREEMKRLGGFADEVANVMGISEDEIINH